MKRPAIVCDLDGCIVATPTKETNDDINFWHNHWTLAHNWHPNADVIDLLHILYASWDVIILTARPDAYRKDTENLLDKLDVSWDHLIMMPGDEILPSNEWKAEQLINIQTFFDIKMVVEDYKPNADEMRKVHPVFLYECKR